MWCIFFMWNPKQRRSLAWFGKWRNPAGLVHRLREKQFKPRLENIQCQAEPSCTLLGIWLLCWEKIRLFCFGQKRGKLGQIIELCEAVYIKMTKRSMISELQLSSHTSHRSSSEALWAHGPYITHIENAPGTMGVGGHRVVLGKVSSWRVQHEMCI